MSANDKWADFVTLNIAKQINQQQSVHDGYFSYIMSKDSCSSSIQLKCDITWELVLHMSSASYNKILVMYMV